MFELALVAGFGYLTYHHAKVRDEEFNVVSRKVGERLGKLWDIAHQGMRENRFLRAEKALLTILKIDEKNAAAYNRLGILYAKQRNTVTLSIVSKLLLAWRPRRRRFITWG